MTRLILVRHGETIWNNEHRFQGSADVPLNEAGLAQAQAVGQKLANIPFSRIVSSDLARAYQTAEAVSQHHSHLTLEKDGRIQEIGFGKWEGLTYAQIQEKYPDDLKAWEANIMTPPTEGESAADFLVRIADFGSQFKPYQKGEVVGIVGHGGSMQMLLCHFLKLPPEAFWRFRMANTAVTEIRLYEDGGMLHSFNDTSHL
ncbi:MAG: alpha-ribazole phosphatase [Chloroflexota bacterium]